MNKPDDAKFFVCEGPALDALQLYKDEIDLMLANHKKLQEEYNELAKKQKEFHEARLYALWVTLNLRVGLDPSKTWQNSEYQVETRYISEGFGAIVYEPSPDNPFKQIFTKGEAEDDSAVIKAPDKGMLN